MTEARISCSSYENPQEFHPVGTISQGETLIIDEHTCARHDGEENGGVKIFQPGAPFIPPELTILYTVLAGINACFPHNGGILNIHHEAPSPIPQPLSVSKQPLQGQ